MINKKEFIKYIDKLKELREVEDAINLAGGKLEQFSLCFTGQYETIVIEILEDIFVDKENGWISYFVYELDFGVKWKENCITMNGKNVYMRNAEELYNVLMDNIKTKANSK